MFLTDLRRWLTQLSRNTSRSRRGRVRAGAARRLPVRLRCEQLEDRLVPAALQPSNFASLGTFNPGPGTYTLDSSAVTLTGPGTAITGVVDPGTGIAVFDFSSVNVGLGVTINAAGSRPWALLSQTDVTV